MAAITISSPHKLARASFLHCGRVQEPRSKRKLPAGPTWSCHDGCHGKAVPNPFSHGDNVWQDAVGLEAPEVRAQPSKSCLHLMGANPNSVDTFQDMLLLPDSDPVTSLLVQPLPHFSLPHPSSSSALFLLLSIITQPLSSPSLY